MKKNSRKSKDRETRDIKFLARGTHTDWNGTPVKVAGKNNPMVIFPDMEYNDIHYSFVLKPDKFNMHITQNKPLEHRNVFNMDANTAVSVLKQLYKYPIISPKKFKQNFKHCTVITLNNEQLPSLELVKQLVHGDELDEALVLLQQNLASIDYNSPDLGLLISKNKPIKSFWCINNRVMVFPLSTIQETVEKLGLNSLKNNIAECIRDIEPATRRF